MVANLVVGDVVEIATARDGIDDAIEAEYGPDTYLQAATGEPEQLLNGWLVEVTAVGEGKILGFYLVGSATDSQRYADIEWSRQGGETAYSKQSCMRTVGRKTVEGYVWTHPNLVNIYFRCQY